MNNIIIRAQNLCKKYNIGATKERHNALRDEIVEGLKAGVPVVLDPGSLSPGEPVAAEE